MDSKQKETNQATSSPAKNVTEKVIFIEICKNCAKHNLSTWHDEAKYKKMFLELKTAIEKESPDVQVFPSPNFKLGGCEVLHGEKLLYSKIKSGLWPNPKAVAQRVAAYFKDLASGKDVSVYSAGVETKYVPPKKPSTAFGGSRYRGMNSTHRSTDALSPDARFLVKDGENHGEADHKHDMTEASKRDFSPKDDHKHHKKDEDPFEFQQETIEGGDQAPHKKEEPKHDEHKIIENKTPKQEDIKKQVSPKKEEIPQQEPPKNVTPKKEAIPKEEGKAEEPPKSEHKNEPAQEQKPVDGHQEAKPADKKGEEEYEEIPVDQEVQES